MLACYIWLPKLLPKGLFMANPNGSRTVGTYLPADLHRQMHAYLRMNGGTVSSFIKASVIHSLEGFPATTPIEEPDAVGKSMRYYQKMRQILPEIALLPPSEAIPHLEEASARVADARPLFELACVAQIAYGDAYLTLTAQVAKLLDKARAEANTPN